MDATVNDIYIILGRRDVEVELLGRQITQLQRENAELRLKLKEMENRLSPTT